MVIDRRNAFLCEDMLNTCAIKNPPPPKKIPVLNLAHGQGKFSEEGVRFDLKSSKL
jgi:hypothetical protein